MVFLWIFVAGVDSLDEPMGACHCVPIEKNMLDPRQHAHTQKERGGWQMHIASWFCPQPHPKMIF